MPAYFFDGSDAAHAQLTKLYDFVWPTAAAMWNLRWQVAGFVQIVPDASVAQLQARFTEGAKIHGANLRRACIEHTWDEQKESFARIALMNTIAIYEGWIEEVLTALGRNTTQIRKSLQFPDPAAGTASTGVTWAIAELTAIESVHLKSNFHPTLRKSQHYAFAKLNAMMRCYRYFKEVRNTDMHGGGAAGQRLLDAYNEFLHVATAAALGVNEVPEHFAPILGEPTRLSLRGVVGFSGIVLRIIATIDAELSRSKPAEKALIAKWKQLHAQSRTLSSKTSRRNYQVKNLTSKAKLPRPVNLGKFGDWLSEKGLTQF